MSKEEKPRNGQYYQVIDGTFRVKVSEDHPEAVKREYETKDGGKGVKYERKVAALFGKVTDVSFYEGDYGKNLIITLDEDEETGLCPIISLSVATNYGEDMLKKLPNINLAEDVRIRPYAFTPEDSDKERRGMEITHRDSNGKFTKKVPNFFYDVEKKVALNGYPTPEGDTKEYSNEDWKIFYLQARKFLVKFTEDKIIPVFAAKVDGGKSFQDIVNEATAGAPDPADIPF